SGWYDDGAVAVCRDVGPEQPIGHVVEAVASLPQHPGDRPDGLLVQPTRVLHLEVHTQTGRVVPGVVDRPVEENVVVGPARLQDGRVAAGAGAGSGEGRGRGVAGGGEVGGVARGGGRWVAAGGPGRGRPRGGRAARVVGRHVARGSGPPADRVGDDVRVAPSAQ